ncbi:PIG-L deacetylase family protein [Culicoidibacter larvae]|nr:PIG-L family deacetylase [Culicoidibacter larvae]
MNQKRVVSIGAHALDAELMGGPYLIKAAASGAKCSFVHMTRGERGNKEKSPEVYGKQLETEMAAVAAVMGADAFWIGYPAGNLPSPEQIVLDWMEYLRQEQVTTVITHWRGSLHPRHILCHDTVTEAVVRLRREGMAIDLYYGENCEDLNGFIPQLYIQFDDAVLETWLAGLREYELFRGGVLTVPYYDYYTTMAKMRSIELGILPYAKAFMVSPHEVEVL